MEVERIFSSDQIKVHPDLGKILREYTKSVIKNDPDDLIEFSWQYFKKKVDEDEEHKQSAMRAAQRSMESEEF
jgi:hypothetical protein